MKKTGGALDGVAWIAESDGTSSTASIGFDDGAQAARVVRGRDGECLVVKPQSTTTDVGRFRAGAITWSKLGKRAAHVSAAPSGTIWLYDDGRRALYRTTNADDATLTTF